MIRPALVLAFIVVLTVAARSFLPSGVGASTAGAALGFGFILIAALQTGHIFHALRLPHLTGFILCGAIVGPEVLGFIDAESVAALGPLKRVAVGLIGLLAGCELNLRALKPKLRNIAIFAGSGMGGGVVVLFATFVAVISLLPATRELPLMERVVIALICANALVAFSPPVVIGVINESRARGPLTEICVPLVVVADLIIVITFSLTTAVGHGVFPSEQSASGLGALLWHVFGSIAAGLVFGTAFAVYLTRVKERVALFIFGTLFVIAEVAPVAHVDPLLIGLTAGLFLENISPVSGHEVMHETEPAAMPTFTLFFAVIGAELHVHAFMSVVKFSVLAAIARAIGVFVGTRIGARRADSDPVVGRFIAFSMLPQAGIALALATSVKSSYKPWGEAVGTILLGTVVVNEVLGPILFRGALSRAGEIPPEDEGPTSSDPGTRVEPTPIPGPITGDVRPDGGVT
ncbi:MAG: cation:proton antiporter [Deltaproteobacteria bacterium]|nr:cation:proton antiporter [Deltaproteobacteria bacterium]